MHVVKEEAFGPVVVVMSHDGDEHAVELANDSHYGLFSYVRRQYNTSLRHSAKT